MATKFGFGYVSKYLVDLWTSPSDRPSPFGTCGQPGQTTSLLPTDHTLRPLAHRAHKGYNNQIIKKMSSRPEGERSCAFVISSKQKISRAAKNDRLKIS